MARKIKKPKVASTVTGRTPSTGAGPKPYGSMQAAIMSAMKMVGVGKQDDVTGYLEQLAKKHPALYEKLLEKLMPFSIASGIDTVRGVDKSKRRLFGKIRLTKINGEVQFDLGQCENPASLEVLFCQMIADNGEWGLHIIPESANASIQLTSLQNGGILIKVVRR